MASERKGGVEEKDIKSPELDSDELRRAVRANLDAMLTPSVKATENAIVSVIDSQERLNATILAFEQVLRDVQSLQEYKSLETPLKKMKTTRERVHTITKKIAVIQSRLDNIREIIRKREAKSGGSKPDKSQGGGFSFYDLLKW